MLTYQNLSSPYQRKDRYYHTYHTYQYLISYIRSDVVLTVYVSNKLLIS